MSIAIRPENLEYLGVSVVSNFDHAIDYEIAERLKGGDCYADYPGWNFHAAVWYDTNDNLFKAMVKQYRTHVDTIAAPTIEELHNAVCEAYGFD